MTLKEAVQVIEEIQRHEEWRDTALRSRLGDAKTDLVNAVQAILGAIEKIDEVIKGLVPTDIPPPENVYYGEE